MSKPQPPSKRRKGRRSGENMDLARALAIGWRDFRGEARKPPATDARAGSVEKFRELQRRAASCQELHSPADGGPDLN